MALGLNNLKEWRDYCTSDARPPDIPAAPARTYKDQGWKGLGDWLGTGNVANHLKQYRPFEDARELARSLNLRSQQQWRNYGKSGVKPRDILTGWSSTRL